MTDAEVESSLMEPGIYRGIPAEDYHALDAASNSRLCRLLKSPAHLRRALDEPDDETVEKARGTAAHAAILEPSRFEAEYAGGPCVDKRTTLGRAEWDNFVADNPGKYCVRGEMWEQITGIRNAVWSHPGARKVLEARSETELAVVWRDEPTGVLCKCRIDITVQSVSVVVDLKTCRDARPESFAKVLYDRGYFRQGAMNLHGLAAHGMVFDQFWLLAVEAEKPHGVMLYQVEDDALEQGWSDLRFALDLYADCKRTGVWPGYPEAVQTLGLPRYRVRETEEAR